MSPNPAPPPSQPPVAAVPAVVVVRPADPPTCKGGQPHEWRYQYGVPAFPPPVYPLARVERFHCAHCTAIEDRRVPPLDGRVDGPQFGSTGP